MSITKDDGRIHWGIVRRNETLLGLVMDLMVSPSEFERWAAVGRLGRLWVPVSFEQAMQETPTDRLKEWGLALPVLVRDRLLGWALDEAQALEEDIETLVLIIEHTEDLTTSLPSLELFVHRRDRLESIAWLLESKLLWDVLYELDEQIVGEKAIFTMPPLGNELCWAVSWQEPYNWWGLMADGFFRSSLLTADDL